jgi:predicted permease
MRLYRILLHLYPAAFRAEYGEELRAIFAARRRDASSPAARVLLWLEVLPDLVLTAGLTHWDILWQDLRLAARTLRGSPGFTLTAILVAALGIGANTAVFSITDHVLVRPLPYPEASRLVRLWEDESARGGYAQMEPSPALWRDWTERTGMLFDAMGAYAGRSLNLVGRGTPAVVEGATVTAGLLPMIGVQPALGRLFRPEEDRAGAPRTIILSDSLWRERFAADPHVLGTKVLLNGTPYDVIGVMPPDFTFPRRDVRYWTPFQFAPDDFDNRQNHFLFVVARLRHGVTLDQARAQMNVIAAQVAREHPESQGTGTLVVRLRDDVSSRSRMMLAALVTASIGVLLIACANLANLLLARALVRRKELALRTALGAGRERLVRQLLTESLLLAIGGGLLGVGLAMAGTPLLAKLVPTSLPIAEAPPIDLRVLALAAVLTSITGIGFGVLPALRACGRLDAATLQEGSRGGIGGQRERVRAALVVATVTLSLALSIASGLLIRALWRVQSTATGFRTEGILTLRTQLPMPKYQQTAKRLQFYDQVLSDVRALPGVTHAGYISFLPMGTLRGGIMPIAIDGQPQDTKELRYASMRFVTPGYFETMAIPLRAGRDVSASDTLSAPLVALVSESFVRTFWPEPQASSEGKGYQHALGRRFTMTGITRTVIGVVGDVRVRGLERSSEPQAYFSWQQMNDGSFVWYAPKDLVIRSSLDAGVILPAVREIVARVDPEQPITEEQTLVALVAKDTSPRVAQLRVLVAFAIVAFLLAGIGIHGLLSFAVSHRRQEIGVRMAMGAHPRDILGMVLREGLVLAAIGVLAGAALAYAAGRSLEALLAGVQPWDPATFATGIGVSLLMALAGCAAPALRAVSVDPLTVLRAE